MLGKHIPQNEKRESGQIGQRTRGGRTGGADVSKKREQPVAFKKNLSY